MHSQESGPTSKGGQNPTPLALFLAFAVGVICFPLGSNPRQFLPWEGAA